MITRAYASLHLGLDFLEHGIYLLEHVLWVIFHSSDLGVVLGPLLVEINSLAEDKDDADVVHVLNTRDKVLSDGS